MDREQALAIVKQHLTDHRYIHTLGVVESAIELARRFGADEGKAELAAIFHDYAKFRSKDEMRTLIRDHLQDHTLLDYGSELLHAPCGAYYVKEEQGITDEDVLNAIRYHTTGRVGMNLLEKVVFLADYIEPNRQFPGVDVVREIAKVDLEGAIIQALENTIVFLMTRRQLIYPETMATYNDLITKQKREK
ncbi:bis(5'-nucleosyl)-tetraphosphatase (symmetrical) YqeK [Halalkalibacter sp. APA_J-10(15)]|uniref:bis(5'-nucleosyl)-tetraphosphatase (symmetrical) YqeK n=1 Tax=Halalkalibacter sp. APA_J-10(15) TaxID=2933805 RepID=UPI001FF175E9|nr:bis(5'-nucleosyl)-tetraphosphatase (symmetrical) YqeK [Halalkalibacter sp. APA_J-10(15)]MCK0471626.1 bis(5'-nucleosyl)-tetraphosphatase (symmetrical) YqeK [Halalkalibacter sp. APA_J-10(15)]